MLRIGVLASHEGTTLQCILDACANGRINGHVAVIISNNSSSGALRRAAAAGSASLHLSSVTHSDAASLDVAIRDALLDAGVHVVFLGGYMKRLGPCTLAAFQGRILNTHPALLPKFGGHGMFGDRVFEAVLAAVELESGASVHLVEAEYDTGAVLRQGRVPVSPGDDVASLKARVQACEREVIVDTLAAIASGELALTRAGVGRTGEMPERAPDQLARDFAEAVTAQADCIERGDPAHGNWHAKQYRTAARELLAAGERAIEIFSGLLGHPNAGVRVMAAAFLLKARTERAVAVLRPIAQGSGLAALGAQMTLARYERGELEIQ